MEHTRFVGLDIHKERISIAVAESGRSCAVEYLGEISNDPVAIGRLCDRLERPSRDSCVLLRGWPVRLWCSPSTHQPRPSLRCSGAVIDSDQTRRSSEDQSS